MYIPCHLTVPEIYIPAQTVTNNDLAAIVNTNDQWIVERTGIKQRHLLANDEQTSLLGLKAAKKTLAANNFAAADLSHVIVATCTPDNLSPSTACIIAGELDCKNIMAFDIEAACTGYIYGASVCRALVCAEPDAKILFICAEALSRRLNWKDRSTCVLFGDGAAACLITSSKLANSFLIKDIICCSDGSLHDLIIVGGGTNCVYQEGDQVGEDFFLSMQGRDTYRHAVRQMVSVCQDLLARNHISIADIDIMIPHQANMRIIEAVGARLKIPEGKVFTNVAEYGNTSAASIPLALREAYNQGKINPGNLALITAFGAGLTWGAALLQF